RTYRKGFGAFAWRIPILVVVSKIVLRHLKLFEGFKVQLGEYPIQAQRGGLRAGGEGTSSKCIKDPVEIYHIKQREGESTQDFVQRFKAESRHVKGAPACMRISGFMHGITNLELVKRLHDNIPMSVDEMMRVTIAFLMGEVAAFNQARKKTILAWKQQEAGENKIL
ncbi:hypothetical protein Tco_0324202, partial [Tanacetum coccineum]